jgi:hypothetical protein
MKGVSRNVHPALVIPLVFVLQESALPIQTNFLAELRDIMGSDDLIAKRYFHGKMPRSQWIRKCALRLVGYLSFELMCGHSVADNI